MGRPPLYAEKLLVRLPEGTTARLDAARVGKETLADVVRAAIERELARRAAAEGD